MKYYAVVNRLYQICVETSCFCLQFTVNKIRISGTKDTVLIFVLMYGSNLLLNIFTTSAFVNSVMNLRIP
jgi:hypothetical protein